MAFARRTLLCLLPTLLLASLCGCTNEFFVTATSPFYDDQDVMYDTGLEGRWILYGDNQPIRYDEHETADAPVKLIFYGDLGTAKKSYDLRIGTIGSGNEMKAVPFQMDGEQFLDLTPSKQEDDHVFLPNVLHTHLIVRVKHQGDVLFLGFLNPEWIKQEVPEERIQTGGYGDDVVLLLPTADLKSLLSKALKTRDGFDKEFRFSKKDSDASSRDLADYGYRLMAQEAMRQGDYSAALHDFQQATNARPDNHDTYMQLVLMQTANGDGNGARQSVAAWKRQCLDVLDRGFGAGECIVVGTGPRDQELAGMAAIERLLIGLSHFAEGHWSAAEREFDSVLLGTAGLKKEPGALDEAILYRSLALMQLKRGTEAAALLNQNHDSLSDQNKVVADYLLGKVKDEDLPEQMKAKQSSWSKDSCNTECLANFYMASRYLSEGDRTKARDYFDKTLGMKEFLGVEL